MPKGFKLDWKGDDVLKQVVKATQGTALTRSWASAWWMPRLTLRC